MTAGIGAKHKMMWFRHGRYAKSPLFFTNSGTVIRFSIVSFTFAADMSLAANMVEQPCSVVGSTRSSEWSGLLTEGSVIGANGMESCDARRTYALCADASACRSRAAIAFPSLRGTLGRSLMRLSNSVGEFSARCAQKRKDPQCRNLPSQQPTSNL